MTPRPSNPETTSTGSFTMPKAWQMDKTVNIHYVDKEAFMNVDIVDKYEEVLIFLESPTYEEVVEEMRIRLKWVDPSDQVELLGIYDVGSAHKYRIKTMPINSNLHWVAYKECATYCEHKVEVEANEYPQYEFGGSAPIEDDGHDSDEEYERHHNIVGDVEAQVRHDDMDPDIVYQRACVDDSDDEGPVTMLLLVKGVAEVVQVLVVEVVQVVALVWAEEPAVVDVVVQVVALVSAEDPAVVDVVVQVVALVWAEDPAMVDVVVQVVALVWGEDPTVVDVVVQVLMVVLVVEEVLWVEVRVVVEECSDT
ncbi:hypothetical protein D1007_36097 [Hordeum vulgare]|nr:hypothetical protein D1007_36097 [Hordeum vulgare]